jgi:hypothetical protein
MSDYVCVLCMTNNVFSNNARWQATKRQILEVFL